MSQENEKYFKVTIQSLPIKKHRYRSEDKKKAIRVDGKLRPVSAVEKASTSLPSPSKEPEPKKTEEPHIKAETKKAATEPVKKTVSASTSTGTTKVAKETSTTKPVAKPIPEKTSTTTGTTKPAKKPSPTSQTKKSTVATPKATGSAKGKVQAGKKSAKGAPTAPKKKGKSKQPKSGNAIGNFFRFILGIQNSAEDEAAHPKKDTRAKEKTPKAEKTPFFKRQKGKNAKEEDPVIQEKKVPRFTIFESTVTEAEILNNELLAKVNDDGYYDEIHPKDYGHEFIIKKDHNYKAIAFMLFAAIAVVTGSVVYIYYTIF